jgi:hypothetical protein
MRTALVVGMVVSVFAASAQSAAPSELDRIAHDYALLSAQADRLGSDGKDGDRKLDAIELEAKAHPLTLPQIVAGLDALVRRIDRLKPSSDRLLAMRQRYIRAHLVSYALQLQPEKMATLPVAKQVELAYGFVPVFPELASVDPAIDALDKALPGPGSLSDRLTAMKKRAQVPKDKIEPVVRTALAECRRRTAAHLNLPKEELVVLFPDDKLIPAQANYEGDGKGSIAISTDYPADVDRLLVTACHEGYPGHHTHFATLDEKLWNKRGWVEGKVGMQFEPLFAVSDAISEYGVSMVFPLDERMKYERELLYPLAGLTMQDEPAWRAYISARSGVLGATSTVIRDYLDKKIDRDRAIELSMRYRLMDRRSAEQLIKMVDAMGILVIASDQGWLAIDRAFAGKPIDEQWRLLQRMEEEPMLLGDVSALAKAH